MSTMSAAEIERLVPKVLARHAREVEPLGSSSWSCGLPNGAKDGLSKTRVRVRLDNGWLSASADVRGGRTRKPMDLLKLGAVFPGGARLAMRRDSQRLFVLRDGWLGADEYRCECEDGFDDHYARASAESGLDAWLRLALSDVKDAVGLLDGRQAAAERPRWETSADHPGFGEICREAGWRCAEHRDGRLAVELDNSRCYRQAFVDPGVAGGVRVWTPLPEVGDLSEPSLQAIETLLLRVNGILRMARAAARESGGRTELVFEALLSADRADRMLNRALSALRIAGRFWAREVDALTDETAARALLTMWGLR